MDCAVSVQTMLNDYRSLLQEQAELQKRGLDLAVQIQVCEKAMELEALLAKVSEPAERPENEKFVENYGHLLDADQLEFLGKETRSTPDVAAYLDLSQQTIRRRCDQGMYQVKNPGSKNRKIITVSVMETLIDVKAEKET